jgi:hypothetical protein
VHHALNPDPYRGAFGSDGEKYARDVQEIIDFGTTGRVGGFISEAIQVHISISMHYHTMAILFVISINSDFLSF